jgi:hypothetical protein
VPTRKEPIVIKDQLLEKGYYVGKVDEIIKDPDTFQKMIDKLIFLSDDKKLMYKYRHVIRMHPEFGGECSVDEIDSRKKMVLENNWTIGQQWYESMKISQNEEMFEFFQQSVTDFLQPIYPEINKHNIRFNDSFTLYEDGDFIENHNDGGYNLNQGRLCVILIYLSDEKDYNNGGGKFILRGNILHEEILPVKGNFVMLDFTKHDLFHEVEEVKNNFQRFCYISFVYNKEKEK